MLLTTLENLNALRKGVVQKKLYENKKPMMRSSLELLNSVESAAAPL